MFLKQKMVMDMKNQVHKMKIQVALYKVKVLKYNLISITDTGRKLNKVYKSKNGFLIIIVKVKFLDSLESD